MSGTWFSVIVILVACWGRSAGAQVLAVQFRDGRVTLHSQDVPLRTILAEWARVGRTAIINGDRVVDVRVALELTEVPEGEAVDLLLRSVGGFIAVRRRSDIPDAAAFDPILILPTSRAATPAPVPVLPDQPALEPREDDLDDAPIGSDSPTSTPGAVPPVLRPRDPARRDD